MNKPLNKTEQEEWEADVKNAVDSVLSIMRELIEEIPEEEPDLDPFLALERTYDSFEEFYTARPLKVPALKRNDLEASLKDALAYHEKAIYAMIEGKTGNEIHKVLEDAVELFHDIRDGSIALIELGRIDRGESRWYTAEEIKEEIRREELLNKK